MKKDIIERLEKIAGIQEYVLNILNGRFNEDDDSLPIWTHACLQDISSAHKNIMKRIESIGSGKISNEDKMYFMDQHLKVLKAFTEIKNKAEVHLPHVKV